MSLLDTASLLLTPNAYKEGKLYSVIPSDGSGDFTFTRATTATRVNSDGLVELVPYNILQRSEEFDNASWNKNGVTINANSTIAPDGNSTADKIVETTTNSNHWVFQSITGNYTLLTISVFMKKGERDFGVIRTRQVLGDRFAYFNLNTGVVGTVDTGLTASIQNVGNGWYRCTVVSSSPTTATNPTVFGVSNSDNSYSYLGDGTSGIFIWGAQLVEGTNALPYQKTETRLNIPRIDYSLGGCPNILLEPQRTNLALQSSSFDSGLWAKTRSTVTANATTSPSGVMDADKLIPSVDNNSHSIAQSSISVTAQIYTASVYAKKGEYDTVRLLLSNLWASPSPNAIFNLTTKTVFSTQNATAKITELENDWFRLEITATINAIAGSTAQFFIYGGDNNILNSAGDGTSGVYIWGAQLEAGSYATSYIPTTTASVTRNLEDSSVTSFSSGIGQTEGVLFTEVTFGSTDNGTKWIAFLWLSGSSYIGIYTDSNGRIFAEITNSGIQFSAISSVFALPNEKHKIALAYKANDFAFYIDGVQIALDNSGTVPACDQVRFNYNTTATYLTQRYYGSLILWKERLTNDQLAQLTTI
jgi:hypothetical protein